MSRYTGPNNKKARAYKISLLENNKEFLKGKKRTTSPGQHGGGRRGKLSNYGEHLYEKQKLRYMYGLNERQMKNTFKVATKMKGVLGVNFLIILESRLDNLVYRAGIANTRRQARQFVNHGLVLVNDKKVDIPSYIAKPNDIISFKEKLKNNVFVEENIHEAKKNDFVKLNQKSMKITFLRFPEREELSTQINESLVVEYYNK